MNTEELNKIAVEIFNAPPKIKGGRIVKLLSYCKGIDGPKNYTSHLTNLCDHLECSSCNRVREQIKNYQYK